MAETNPDLQRRNQALAIVGGIVVLLLIVGGGFYIIHQQKQLNMIEEQAAIDKQLLEEDYNELALQYEGYRFNVRSDSLAHKLATEQAKVQRLLEELRTVKTSNAARINELKRELSTLRQVLRSYVEQVDSLNRANQALRIENKEVKEEISRITSQREQLRAESQKLSAQVQLAAKLSISSLSVRGLNSRGKVTKRIQNMKQLQFDFQIDRNLTAEPGMKTIYLRITKPDGTLLQQAESSGTFSFEDGQVPYSISRQVEYGGEPAPMTMYWDIQEYLIEGEYLMEFFADGYMIGRSIFALS